MINKERIFQIIDTLQRECQPIDNHTDSGAITDTFELLRELIAESLFVEWVNINDELPPKSECVYTCYLEDNDVFYGLFSGYWTGQYTSGKNALVIDYGYEDDWYPATHWLKHLDYPKIK